MILLKKIIEYSLYLLVFLLPLQTRLIIKVGEINGGFSEYNSISIYGIDIFLFAIIILNLFFIFKENNSKFKIVSYWKWIISIEFFIFISIFFADDKILAFYRYGLFLLGTGLFWLVVSANYNKLKLFFSLLFGFFIQACLGVWQFLAQSSFSFKWLGLAEHKASELGVSVVETLGVDGIGERWLRAYGGLDHPNIFGGVLTIGILLIFYLLIFKKQNKRIKIIFYLFYFAFVAGLFFSFSRGAWLGLFFGLAIILFFVLLKKELIKQRDFLEIILVGGFFVFILFFQYENLVLVRVSGSSRLEVKSNTERIETFKEGKDIIKDNWLFGVGIGNYAQKKASLENDIKKQSYNYQPVHNIFLLIWAEIGLIGLVCFLGFLGFLGWNNFKNKNYFGLSILSSLVIMMLVDHWLWSLHFGVLFFWLLAGLIVKDNN